MLDLRRLDLYELVDVDFVDDREYDVDRFLLFVGMDVFECDIDRDDSVSNSLCNGAVTEPQQLYAAILCDMLSSLPMIDE